MAASDLALASLRIGDHHLLSSDHLDQVARSLGHVFRDSTLTPGRTLSLFVQQIAHGNVACAAMGHMARRYFTDMAWCLARKRLRTDLIQQLNQRVVEEIARCCGSAETLWRGHRTTIVDGSSDSMPDTKALRERYGVSSTCPPGTGFPTSRLLLLMDQHSGAVLDCHDFHGNTHDGSVAHLTHDKLAPGDIVLGDDAFASYTHLALLLRSNLHAVMPAQHLRIVDFTPGRGHAPPTKNKARSAAGLVRSRQVRILGEQDQIVEYFKPPQRPKWMSPEQWKSIPESIEVREIRRLATRHGFRAIEMTVITTLLDPQAYPADDIIDLRLTRWMIETNLRHLKMTLGMDKLKCRTLASVRKERLVFVLVYNLVRLIMLQSARVQKVNPNRISFANTLAWIRFGTIQTQTRLKINPLRPGRLQPRVIKRRKKQFPYMLKPRQEHCAELRARQCVTT